jgi:hypothetical protein
VNGIDGARHGKSPSMWSLRDLLNAASAACKEQEFLAESSDIDPRFLRVLEGARAVEPKGQKGCFELKYINGR